MFTDVRLAALYDLINPHVEDTPFYIELAREVAPADVIDLGCGTGRLALALSAHGHSVTAIDPSAPMLEVARSKPGATEIRWIEGGADDLEGLHADLVLMTGHVAQFFLSESAWVNALNRIRRVLRPNGRLAFETRNPVSKPWEMWTRERSHKVTRLASGQLETWYETASVQDRRVTYSLHYRLPTGEAAREDNVVIFRNHEEITQSLSECGYVLTQNYGDWDRSSLSYGSPELIYVAKARSSRMP